MRSHPSFARRGIRLTVTHSHLHRPPLQQNYKRTKETRHDLDRSALVSAAGCIVQYGVSSAFRCRIDLLRVESHPGRGRPFRIGREPRRGPRRPGGHEGARARAEADAGTMVELAAALGGQTVLCLDFPVRFPAVAFFNGAPRRPAASAARYSVHVSDHAGTFPAIPDNRILLAKPGIAVMVRRVSSVAGGHFLSS